jgi:hypothetical protein
MYFVLSSLKQFVFWSYPSVHRMFLIPQIHWHAWTQGLGWNKAMAGLERCMLVPQVNYAIVYMHGLPLVWPMEYKHATKVLSQLEVAGNHFLSAAYNVQGDWDRHRNSPSLRVQILWFYRKMVRNQHQTLVFFDVIKNSKNFWCMLPTLPFSPKIINSLQRWITFKLQVVPALKPVMSICSTLTIKFFSY